MGVEDKTEMQTPPNSQLLYIQPPSEQFEMPEEGFNMCIYMSTYQLLSKNR